MVVLPMIPAQPWDPGQFHPERPGITISTAGWSRAGNDMRIPIYQVDGFASRVFEGNPAAAFVVFSEIDPRCERMRFHSGNIRV